MRDYCSGVLRETHALAEEGVHICEQLGFPSWLPGLAQLRDWTLVVEDSDGDALRRMQGRISPGVIAGQLLPANVVLLVDACVRLRERELGTVAVERGLELTEALGQQWIVAELHRLHAELLTLDKVEGSSQAEVELELSLRVARQQRAKAIELRSATALARLWAGTGDVERAHDLLKPVYETFTAGVPTQDLQQAQALLGELS